MRDEPETVARRAGRLAAAHARDGRAHYYDVRDAQFNPLREERRQPDGRIAYTPALAAMLIYLNRTGFNGLFRVNARGAFNVPAGRYVRPRIVDRARLSRRSPRRLPTAASAWYGARSRWRTTHRGGRTISSTSIRRTRR